MWGVSENVFLRQAFNNHSLIGAQEGCCKLLVSFMHEDHGIQQTWDIILCVVRWTCSVFGSSCTTSENRWQKVGCCCISRGKRCKWTRHILHRLDVVMKKENLFQSLMMWSQSVMDNNIVNHSKQDQLVICWSLYSKHKIKTTKMWWQSKSCLGGNIYLFKFLHHVAEMNIYQGIH